jgi:uncharacterized protein (TIGR03437 family)
MAESGIERVSGDSLYPEKQINQEAVVTKKRVFNRIWQVALAISAVIAPAAAQVLTVSPSQLQFSIVQSSSTVPNPQTINITSDTPTIVQSVSVSYAPAASGWLTVLPVSQATPVASYVYLNTAVTSSLLPGQYSASITINASPASNSPQSVGVFLTVVGSGTGGGVPTITVTPNLLTFSYTPGSAVPASQVLNVNVGDGSGFLVTSSTNDGGAWLTVSPTQAASTPAQVTVSVNPAGLGAGTYAGTINLIGILSISVPVTFTVGTVPITTAPTALTFNIPQNFGLSAPQFLAVTAAAPVTFYTAPSSDNNWLQTDIPSGTTPALVAVRANAGLLAQGTYTGQVVVQQTPANAVAVPVTMVIGPPAVISIAPASVGLLYTLGDPSPITQTIRINSLSTTPQTFTLATNLITGTGWLTATANTLTTPSIITVTVNATGLTPGNYLGTINVTPSGAVNPQQISVALTVAPAPTPVITAVQNAASGAPNTVAPGELVTIVGRGVGPKTLVSFTPVNNFVPTALGNTKVTFDGVAAPIIYASSGATTVQVPYSITPGVPTNLQVTYTTSPSAVIPLGTQAIYPGLFSANSTGKGQAAVLNQDFSVNSPANPAARGSTIVLYGTGEGVVTPALATGQIVPLTPPFPAPAVKPVVFFNGVQGTVLYAGEAPGSVSGVFQINVQIPNNIQVGPISVQAAFGGQATQSGLTVSVQ